MNIRVAAIALTALVALAGAVFAQSDDLARVRARFDVAETERLELLIADAVQDGVPRSLLVQKAVEGTAKGMRPAVVIEGVAVWADELRGAIGILGRGTEPAGLTKAAESIRMGVDREVIGTLAADYPTDYPIMLVAIEDLLHAGVDLEEAQEMVLDATSKGLRGQEVLTMSATLRRLVREGSTPVDAATSIRNSLRTNRTVIPPAPPTEPPVGAAGGRNPSRSVPPPPPPFHN